MTLKADFPLFLILWNRRQEMGTPPVHLRMADWLAESWAGGRRRLLLMAFRSCGKSTLTGLFAAWLLYRNPDLRILVLAADGALARRMVRNVKRILERHPLTAALKPERADQWASDRFTVKRNMELRDPSMMARGISANLTGSRADVIICDDVEVPNTCDTAEKRDDLRERLAETDYVLTPGGLQLYAGTPHTFETIYDETGFLRGFEALRLPLLNARGESAWPERFTDADVARIRAATGPNKFASQMMLVPVNIAQGRLDPDLLVRYGGEPELSKELGALYLGGRKIVSCSAWWDPAFGGQGRDRSILAVVYADEGGAYWLHRVLSVAQDGEGDEATRQCRAVALLARQYHIPSVALEINGIGRFLPGILRRELAREKAACAVREVSSRRPKDIRILEAFDAVLAARALRAHDSVYEGPLIGEMRDWRPGIAGGHDDALDAVAGALSLEPARPGANAYAGRQPWTGGGKAHKAGTAFEV